MAAAMVRNPLSLYVHIPFCTLKCSYCDFNSYAGIESLMRPFVDALCDEMPLWAPVVADRRVEAAFFGGGTPSLLPVKEVERVVGAMRGAFELAPDAEVPRAATPGSVERASLRNLLAAGLHRRR